ncbi:MAG TPA: metalloregulator ArsR/SmtB family transcription factor [Opitutaceae bacterium]
MADKSRLLTDQAIELVARRFAILSEPMRLRLLRALMEGERNVNSLVAATGGTQANISRHLQALAQAGMVARRKEGLQVFYTIADPSIFQLCDLVCHNLERQMTERTAILKASRSGK